MTAPRATTAEAAAAIALLTPRELRGLYCYAHRRLGACFLAGELEAAELVHEAIALTLEGRRTWNPAASIGQHLLGTVHSLSSHLAAHRALRVEAMGDLSESHGMPAVCKPADLQLEAAEDVAELRGLFTGDRPVTRLLDGMALGERPCDVQEAAGWDAVALNTVALRMRRTLKRAGKTKPRGRRLRG